MGLSKDIATAVARLVAGLPMSAKDEVHCVAWLAHKAAALMLKQGMNDEQMREVFAAGIQAARRTEADK